MTVKKPIKCPCCSVITAIPIDGGIYLTPAAAGFYPSGYRCKTHGGVEIVPQPSDAPARLSKEAAAYYLARFEKRAAA